MVDDSKIADLRKKRIESSEQGIGGWLRRERRSAKPYYNLVRLRQQLEESKEEEKT
jgi:hypothetical protein